MTIQYGNEGNTVATLQFMLHVLSRQNPSISAPIVDGRFGEETLEAVMTFQREHGLPVTGIVDDETWNAVVAAHEGVSAQALRPRPANLYPHSSHVILPGESSVHLFPIQGMLSALSHSFENILPSHADGTLSGQTLANIQTIQQHAGLQQDSLDHDLWDILVRLYDTFVVRRGNPYGTGQ